VLRKEGSPVGARDDLRSNWPCEFWTFGGRPRGAVDRLVLSTRPFKWGPRRLLGEVKLVNFAVVQYHAMPAVIKYVRSA